MSEVRKTPRLSRVKIDHIKDHLKNHPDPATLDTFIRERDEQDRLEADLNAFFKEILTQDEFKVLSLTEGLFGEGSYSLDDIGKKLMMTDREIIMLRESAWRKIKGYQDRLQNHLRLVAAKTKKIA